MEAAVIAFLVFGVAWIARQLHQQARWEPSRTLRGSQPEHEPALPPGTQSAALAAIEELRPGYHLAVIGTVIGQATLVAPMSRRLCVASDLVICDRMTGAVVARSMQSSLFEIEDETGTVIVDGRGAYLRISCNHTLEGIERERLDEALRAQVPETLWIDAHEGSILPGTDVLVTGLVQTADDPESAAFRGTGRARLRIAGGAQWPAMVSNLPDDLRTVGR